MGKTVIIPAAGLASRLRPISNFTSKSMIPVNGKPAIGYIIDEIKDWATDIRIVYRMDDIVEYCDRVYPDLSIKFYKQDSPDGPLHAIWSALEPTDIYLKNDLTVWLGDTIVLDYNPLEVNTECSIVYNQVSDWDRWCLIDNDGNLFDKPKDNPGTNKALVGIYQFSDLTKAHTLIENIIQLDEPKIKNEFQISQLLKEYSNISLIETKEWYDCGDFPSLYESRARLLDRLSRDDNSLSVDTISGTITKSGNRCRSEIEWYSNINRKILPFVPSIYDITDQSYTMEFCPGTSLQDVFVYENLKEDTIVYTINKVLDVQYRCFIKDTKIRNNKTSVYMWIDKNLERFYQYSKYNFVKENDLQSMINMVESESFYNLIKQNRFVDTIHGDLHFGNILFDYNTGKVKFIDPRGNWNNQFTTKGDLEYDIAKLYQSVYGEYMWIVNNLNTNLDLQELLIDQLDQHFSNNNLDTSKFKLLSIVMMASCLPFHEDNVDRQKRIWDTSINKLQEFL